MSSARSNGPLKNCSLVTSAMKKEDRSGTPASRALRRAFAIARPTKSTPTAPVPRLARDVVGDTVPRTHGEPPGGTAPGRGRLVATRHPQRNEAPGLARRPRGYGPALERPSARRGRARTRKVARSEDG